jgi:hypothetical protein
MMRLLLVPTAARDRNQPVGSRNFAIRIPIRK